VITVYMFNNREFNIHINIYNTRTHVSLTYILTITDNIYINIYINLTYILTYITHVCYTYISLISDIVNLDVKSTLRVLYNLFTKYKNIS